MKHYLVNGKILIPGTLQIVKVFARVIARDLGHAAKSVAPVVSDRAQHSLSAEFCQRNLRFTVVG